MPEEGAGSSPKTATLGHARIEIFQRLQHCVEQCCLNYSGKKELATESDDTALELCQALEDTFSYGLRQQSNFVTAASIFQNMQEIVTGSLNGSSSANETTFWDFCQLHLTPHEKDRFEQLRHVWTKRGRTRAFIRAALNENALQRYVLTWLNAKEELQRYYTHWSLLLHAEMSNELPKLIGSLEDVLFALTTDTTELNAHTRTSVVNTAKLTREEPIIYAPDPASLPVKIVKRKVNAIERPIASTNSTEDLMAALQETSLQHSSKPITEAVSVNGAEEEPATLVVKSVTPPPEFGYRKLSLPDVSQNEDIAIALEEFGSDDTSSQYSKSSSANCCIATTATATSAVTEELADTQDRLQQMTERCALLETRVAQLSLENRQLLRRLTQFFEATGIDPSSTVAGYNFLLTIPNVQLMKKAGRAGATTSYHAYEIHITMRQNLEHWSLWRRYRDFHKLHQSLLRSHPSVSSVDFPPKKHFGNMNRVFVEERRHQLEFYLLNLVEMLPQVEACKTKAELQKVFPFLREK